MMIEFQKVGSCIGRDSLSLTMSSYVGIAVEFLKIMSIYVKRPSGKIVPEGSKPAACAVLRVLRGPMHSHQMRFHCTVNRIKRNEKELAKSGLQWALLTP